MTRVVHCKREKFDVFIGRPSVWGNPFVFFIDGNREEVIRKYKWWLLNNKALCERARSELKDKVLGCWCSPEPCHGDVLAHVADGTLA